MTRLTIDGIRAVLPDLDELRPLADRLLADSVADPTRTWTGSGELGTAGNRLVDGRGLEGEARSLAEREGEHLTRIFQLTARAIAALQEGDSDEAASAFLEASSLEEGRDRSGRAAAYADSAYRIAREGSGAELTSLALRRRARARRAAGRYAESEHDYEEAWLIGESAGDVRGAAEAAIGAGNVREEQGRWDEAKRWYRRALDLLDTLDEPTPEVWHALLNLHVVLRSEGSLDVCLDPLERAERIATDMGDASAAQFIENARGQLRMALGDFERAERHLRLAIDASTGARARVTIRLNLAETLFAMGRTLDSAEEARRAERETLRARLPQKLPEVYRLLGRIAASEGSPDAFVLFERALEIITDRALPSLERAQTLQAYADAEQQVGELETAGRLHEEADRLYRQLGIARRRHQWADRFDREAEGPDHQTGTTDHD